jgi:hypothetical protein
MLLVSRRWNLITTLTSSRKTVFGPTIRAIIKSDEVYFRSCSSIDVQLQVDGSSGLVVGVEGAALRPSRHTMTGLDMSVHSQQRKPPVDVPAGEQANACWQYQTDHPVGGKQQRCPEAKTEQPSSSRVRGTSCNN